MRHIIPIIFPKFTAPLEGDHLTWPYPDVKNLITVGDGNLIDPVSVALTLPWKNPDGSPVPRDQVIAQWTHLKSLNLGQAGAWSAAVKNATSMRLSNADIDALIVRQLVANDAVLARIFKDWENFCADAQLALHSLSWAMGPGEHTWQVFGNLNHAILAGDWFAAEQCIDLSTKGNAGVGKRNVADRLCCHNAGIVEQYGLDPDVLYWPNAAAASPALSNDSASDAVILANVALAKLADKERDAPGSAGANIAEDENSGQSA